MPPTIEATFMIVSLALLPSKTDADLSTSILDLLLLKVFRDHNAFHATLGEISFLQMNVF